MSREKKISNVTEIPICNSCGKPEAKSICIKCYETLVQTNNALTQTNANLSTRINTLKEVIKKSKSAIKEKTDSIQQQHYILLGREASLTEILNLIENQEVVK